MPLALQLVCLANPLGQVVTPKNGRPADPGFKAVAPGSGDHDAASLGLPPSIHDGASSFSYDSVVLPGL